MPSNDQQNSSRNRRFFFLYYFLPNFHKVIATLRYLFIFLFGTTATLAHFSSAIKLTIVLIAFGIGLFFYVYDKKSRDKKSENFNERIKRSTIKRLDSKEKKHLTYLFKNISSIQWREKYIILISNFVFQFLLFDEILMLANRVFSKL